jgi:uncharacterized Ntn-hydrolase superfamily protein
MTFSIVGRADHPSGDPEWGVAVASRFLAVGNAVPAAVAGIGAIATQAMANVAYKAQALAHLDEGATAQIALDRLLADDPDREHRQVGIIGVDAPAATYTGRECFPWAGGYAGDDVAIQGNILTGPEVVEAMEQAWQGSEGQSIERRLLAALAAGDSAGGDSRGRQSAALLVVRDGAGYGGHDDVAVDLRVDDHADPVTELARLVGLNELYLTASTPEEQVPVDDALMIELEALAKAEGHDHFREWVGSENYEMRVAPGLRPAWSERRILAISRGGEEQQS